jgi:two-component system chemotaxis response regulator CheV
MYNKDDILLESGTGEVEVLVFSVGDEEYAINVVKVKEILNIDNIAKIPDTHMSVPGVSLIRGEVITVIDMNYVLEKRLNEDVKNSMTLVCEFNKMKVAFAIDEVKGISRIGWKDIKKPSTITSNSLVIGNIELNERIVMLLDFEKIVMDISPEAGINEARIEAATERDRDRSKYKMVLADDSPLIREVLSSTLIKAGFTNLKFFNDGMEAYEYLFNLKQQHGKEFKDYVDMLITDIEMPQLDGHTLTRRVKEDSILKDLPVIIFSSLITNDLKHKGDSVGADGQMSKPEVQYLVNLIDEILEK